MYSRRHTFDEVRRWAPGSACCRTVWLLLINCARPPAGKFLDWTPDLRQQSLMGPPRIASKHSSPGSTLSQEGLQVPSGSVRLVPYRSFHKSLHVLLWARSRLCGRDSQHDAASSQSLMMRRNQFLSLCAMKGHGISHDFRRKDFKFLLASGVR